MLETLAAFTLVTIPWWVALVVAAVVLVAGIWLLSQRKARK